jgi:hypothetical protein
MPTTPPSTLGLDNLAERIGTQANQKNPIIEQALRKGLAEQVTATVEQTEQAAGLTGAAQTAMSSAQLLEAIGIGGIQAHARRVENQSRLLEIQAGLLGQSGQLEQQRYETDLRHQEFLMQLKAQERASQTNLVAGIAGGAASAFLGGAGFASLLSTATSDEAPADDGGGFISKLSGLFG